MKTVLVTGAAGGMGRAAVRQLLACGYRVFALDRAEPPTEFAEHKNLTYHSADLTKAEAVRLAFDAICKQCDSLYAILHLAGCYRLDSLVEMSEDAFVSAFRINLDIAFLVNRTFLPLLTSGSRILTVTSELADLSPMPFTGIYALTKAALDQYCFSLRMELQLLGIHVSVLRAGAVQTDMLGASTDALERFCAATKHYALSAKRFRQVVDGVEAKAISPDRLAKKACAILGTRKPRFAYAINRNPLLLLYGALPSRIQFAAIRWILKP